MSYRAVITVTNLAYFICAVYFIVLALLSESSGYIIIPAILCIVSIGLGAREDLFFSGPWRVATSVLVLVLLIAAEIADFEVNSIDPVNVTSILINGALLLVFVGVFLSSIRDIIRLKTSDEIEEEEEKKEGEERRQEPVSRAEQLSALR